jgi:hypothetical protein
MTEELDDLAACDGGSRQASGRMDPHAGQEDVVKARDRLAKVGVLALKLRGERPGP